MSFGWNEKLQTLTIGNLQGTYAGSLKKRVFNIFFVSEGNDAGIGNAAIRKEVVYIAKA